MHVDIALMDIGIYSDKEGVAKEGIVNVSEVYHFIICDEIGGQVWNIILIFQLCYLL